MFSIPPEKFNFPTSTTEKYNRPIAINEDNIEELHKCLVEMWTELEFVPSLKKNDFLLLADIAAAIRCIWQAMYMDSPRLSQHEEINATPSTVKLICLRNNDQIISQKKIERFIETKLKDLLTIYEKLIQIEEESRLKSGETLGETFNYFLSKLYLNIDTLLLEINKKAIKKDDPTLIIYLGENNELVIHFPNKKAIDNFLEMYGPSETIPATYLKNPKTQQFYPQFFNNPLGKIPVRYSHSNPQCLYFLSYIAQNQELAINLISNIKAEKFIKALGFKHVQLNVYKNEQIESGYGPYVESRNFDLKYLFKTYCIENEPNKGPQGGTLYFEKDSPLFTTPNSYLLINPKEQTLEFRKSFTEIKPRPLKPIQYEFKNELDKEDSVVKRAYYV